MDELVIGFAGLTHLGVNSLAAAAERGFYVLGFDENPETVDAMSNGQVDINEDGLTDLLKKNKDKISYSADPTDLRKNGRRNSLHVIKNGNFVHTFYAI